MFSQLRSTLMLFAASLCLLVALAGGVGLYGTRLNHTHFDQLQTHRAVAEQITAINYKVFDSRLHIALALSDRTPERQRKEAEVIGKNLQNLRQSSQALAALPLPAELAQPVQQFMAVVSAFSDAYLNPAQAAMQRGDVAALEHLLTSQEERFYTPIKQGREGIQRAQHNAARRWPNPPRPLNAPPSSWGWWPYSARWGWRCGSASAPCAGLTASWAR